MGILEDIFSLTQGQDPVQKRRLFGALNRMQGGDAPGDLIQRSLMNADGQTAPAAPMAEPMNVSGPAPAPTPDANTALPSFSQRSFRQGLRDFGNALQGNDVPDREAEVAKNNETFNFLVRKGLPEADARAVVQNPQLMQQVLPALVGSKSQGQFVEYFDEATGQPRKGLMGTDGQIKPIGGVKAAEPKRVSIGEQTPAEREAVAKQYGLDPNSDAGRSFILTGKLPREDQQMLTATDKKFIEEADDKVLSNTTAIQTLNDALKLSAKAYDGASANERGWLTSQFGSAAGEATREFNNLLTQTALEQLKSTFGAAPTEGERKILLEIQGAAELPQATRENIIRRAIALAEKRLAFNRDRAAQLRGGTFYKPQGEGSEQPAASGLGGAPARAKNANGDVIEYRNGQWVPVQ